MKLARAIPTYPLEWLKSNKKNLTIYSVHEHVVILDRSYISVGMPKGTASLHSSLAVS